jgi:hypothetical protein
VTADCRKTHLAQLELGSLQALELKVEAAGGSQVSFVASTCARASRPKKRRTGLLSMRRKLNKWRSYCIRG